MVAKQCGHIHKAGFFQAGMVFNQGEAHRFKLLAMSNRPWNFPKTTLLEPEAMGICQGLYQRQPTVPPAR